MTASMVPEFGGTKEQMRAKKLRDELKRANFFTFHPDYGLTYQSCRFCKVGVLRAPGRGLWKYQVRHYACTPCRDARLGKGA